MPKYMYSGNYTKEGAAGLLKDGKARKEEAMRIVEAMGGSLEAYYWSFGEMDFMMIADIPQAMAVKFFSPRRSIWSLQWKADTSHHRRGYGPSHFD